MQVRVRRRCECAASASGSQVRVRCRYECAASASALQVRVRCMYECVAGASGSVASTCTTPRAGPIHVNEGERWRQKAPSTGPARSRRCLPPHAYTLPPSYTPAGTVSPAPSAPSASSTVAPRSHRAGNRHRAAAPRLREHSPELTSCGRLSADQRCSRTSTHATPSGAWSSRRSAAVRT